MNEGLSKALRRARKITVFLRHVSPGSDADANDIIQWARAADASSTVERYLERCAKDAKRQ